MHKWIAPLFQKVYQYITLEANPTVTYTAMQPFVNAQRHTTKFGFMPPATSSDVITAQTTLRGVQPVFALEVARSNDQQVMIS